MMLSQGIHYDSNPEFMVKYSSKKPIEKILPSGITILPEKRLENSFYLYYYIVTEGRIRPAFQLFYQNNPNVGLYGLCKLRYFRKDLYTITYFSTNFIPPNLPKYLKNMGQNHHKSPPNVPKKWPKPIICCVDGTNEIHKGRVIIE